MKMYRPGRTIWPFLIWTGMNSILASLVSVDTIQESWGIDEGWIAGTIFACCIVLGPLALVAQAIRRWTVSVSIDEYLGLIISKKRLLKWDEIDRMEYRPSPFRPKKKLANTMDVGFTSKDGCLFFMVGGEGCLLAFALLIVVGVFYYILLPVFFLFSPWHSRVVVHLKNGRKIVYRDLDEDEEFVRISAQALQSDRTRPR